MPTGQIIKAVSGFYYVQASTGDVLRCRARGVFKLKAKKVTPLVGDYVKYEVTRTGEGIVVLIAPRRTQLLRPPIANVDQAVVICSLREPHFQQMPVDRFLVYGEREGIEIKICLTKRDLLQDQDEIVKINAIYGPTKYPIIVTSVKAQIGIQELKQHLIGRVSVLVGQSGVGKSSLLKQLLPDHTLEIGEVSPKLGRGRHTTRVIELLSLPEGGQVADTPGFSQLTLQGFTVAELAHSFPEFAKYAINCRFRGCLHRNEPDCMVKEAVEAGKIHQERYDHYLLFLNEVEEQQGRY